jgi:hypothetical protein
MWQAFDTQVYNPVQYDSENLDDIAEYEVATVVVVLILLVFLIT